MPRITLALTSNYENISRPVAMSVARDVMRVCNIAGDTPLYMKGEFDTINQPGSVTGGGDDVHFESGKRMIVTCEDSLKNDSVMQQVVRQNDLPPILEDRKLGVSLRPVYMKSDVILAFKYVCATRQEAIRWRDEFAVKRAENRTSISHEVEYDIPISDGTIALLAHLHERREAIAGYGESFSQWFQAIQLKKVTMAGTRDGNNKNLTLVVHEKQAQITGWFDFTDIPKERKVNGNSTWEIEFNYNLTYDRCTHLYFVYPMVVHQQHIGADYFDAKPRFGVEELQKTGSIGITALDMMNEYVNYFPEPAGGLRVPYYDEWSPPKSSQPPFSVPIMSWMIVLDPDDPQDILDLTTLPDMMFVTEIDTLLRETHAGLTTRGQSPILFTLFSDDNPMAESVITIDEHLRVRATRPLDMRKSYHLRLSFVTDYTQLSKATVLTMKTHALATLFLFQTVVPVLDVQYAVMHLVDDRFLSTNYIIWFYQYLIDHGLGCFNQGGNRTEGRASTNPNWRGGIVGVGSNKGGRGKSLPTKHGPRDASFYTGSNWRVNTADGAYSNPDGSGGGGNGGWWDEDGNWVKDPNYPGGGGNGNGGGVGGNNGGGGWIDITDGGTRSRPNGGNNYVQFLRILTKRK